MVCAHHVSNHHIKISLLPPISLPTTLAEGRLPTSVKRLQQRRQPRRQRSRPQRKPRDSRSWQPRRLRKLNYHPRSCPSLNMIRNDVRP